MGAAPSEKSGAPRVGVVDGLRDHHADRHHLATGMSTREIQRPMPSEPARRGLLHVNTMEVTFDGASDRDQEEALNHINELIEFWNLKYLEWKP